MNGSPLREGVDDTAAARCSALIERGLAKFGIRGNSLGIRFRPYVPPVPAKKPPGRPRMDHTGLHGLTTQEIVNKTGYTKQKAGMIRAMLQREARAVQEAAK
jgi:hypothetical protein